MRIRNRSRTEVAHRDRSSSPREVEAVTALHKHAAGSGLSAQLALLADQERSAKAARLIVRNLSFKATVRRDPHSPGLRSD